MESPPADEYEGDIVEAGELPVPDEGEDEGELGGEPSEYRPDENEQEQEELGGDPLPDEFYETMGDVPG